MQRSPELEALVASPEGTEAFEEGAVGWATTRLTITLPDGGHVSPRWSSVFHREGDTRRFVQTHASIGVGNDDVGWIYSGRGRSCTKTGDPRSRRARSEDAGLTAAQTRQPGTGRSPARDLSFSFGCSPGSPRHRTVRTKLRLPSAGSPAKHCFRLISPERTKNPSIEPQPAGSLAIAERLVPRDELCPVRAQFPGG